MKHIVIGLTLSSLMFLISCNSQSYMKVEDIPVPKEANSKIPEGSFEVKLDSISNRLFQSLKDENKKVEDKIYALPDNLQFSVIQDFYDETLEKMGCVYEEGHSKTPNDYNIQVWEKSGLMQTETIMIAVIYIEKDDGYMQFLNIFLAKN